MHSPNPALAVADRLGLRSSVSRHGPVRSLAEADAARGVAPSTLIKTMVVRVTDGDYRYPGGAITPPGSTSPWPVVVDERVRGTVSSAAAEHGVALSVDAAASVEALGATVADITDLGARSRAD